MIGETPNYYAVIPPEVRYNQKLKSVEKLLYGEISALANINGYCNASNEYFARLYGCHKNTISDYINNLKKENLVTTEIIRNEKKEVVERRIYLYTKLRIPLYAECRIPPKIDNR